MLFHASVSLMLFLLTIQTSAYGFNLALDKTTARYMVSPVVEKLGTGSPPQLPNNVKSSFYGYDFKLFTRSDGSISMAIGSPKLMDPSSINRQMTRTNMSNDVEQGPKGGIQFCQIDKGLFEGSAAPQCNFAQPRSSQPNDTLGMSVPITPSGNMMTCSITRVQDCGNLTYVPGYCFKSNNYGATWRKDDRTKQLRCPTDNVELLFVLDGSASVGDENFLKVKKWVKNIARELDIDNNAVTVGVVQYSHYFNTSGIQSQRYIKTHIKIGQYKTYKAFAAAMKKINLFGYTTWTGAALRKVIYDFENTNNYFNWRTKQIMVLLTDGRASDSQTVPENAKKLRDIGVTPYAVGVGNYNITELRIIANGDPKDNTRVFSAKNFNGLDKIARELENAIGSLVLEGGQNALGFKTEFGAVGLVGAYSKFKPKTKRLRRDTRINSVIYNRGLKLMW